MTTFVTAVKFAAAYNPMSSFRLLQSDTAAEMHLRTMAAALQPGGVYVLDMTFLSNADEPAITTDESWEMTRGKRYHKSHERCGLCQRCRRRALAGVGARSTFARPHRQRLRGES